MEVVQQVCVYLVRLVYVKFIHQIVDIVCLRTEKFLLVKIKDSIRIKQLIYYLGIVASIMLVDDYQLLMDRGWRK